jgi:hypothetical protein
MAARKPPQLAIVNRDTDSLAAARAGIVRPTVERAQTRIAAENDVSNGARARYEMAKRFVTGCLKIVTPSYDRHKGS